MKMYALLLFGVAATSVSAQEPNLGTFTVRDVQELYRAGEQDENLKALVIFLDGYLVGHAQGTAWALARQGLVTRDISVDFADCAPNAGRLAYLVLGVSDERQSLNLPQFAAAEFRSSCATVLEALGEGREAPR